MEWRKTGGRAKRAAALELFSDLSDHVALAQQILEEAIGIARAAFTVQELTTEMAEIQKELVTHFTHRTGIANETHATLRLQICAPDYVGLRNQAATCYMNSLLQALYMTPELRYALYSWRWTAGRDKPKEECIPYQLQLLFCRLQTVDSR